MSLSDAEFEPMLSRRSAWLEKVVRTNWAIMQQDYPGERYTNEGTTDTYLFYGINRDSATMAEDAIKRAQAAGRTPHIIDIGAAQCGVLADIRDASKDLGEVQLTAVSAHDYAARSSAWSDNYRDIDYLVGDAQDPEFLRHLPPADLIMSRYALVHMPDALGVVETMANLLAPGGQLVTDRFELCDQADANGISVALEASGFTWLAPPEMWSWQMRLAIERDDSGTPVRFPYDYGAEDEHQYILRGEDA